MEQTINNKDNIVKLFICAAKSHHSAFESRIVDFGVHRSQHRILMLLSRRDQPTTQKDIAEAFDISAAAVAVSVKKLESDGFIQRECDKNDSRSNIIKLTKKGMMIVEQTKHTISSLDEAMFADFNDSEIAEFSAFLSRLCDNIRNFSATDPDNN